MMLRETVEILPFKVVFAENRQIAIKCPFCNVVSIWGIDALSPLVAPVVCSCGAGVNYLERVSYKAK